jgi:hypothetical protein
MVQTSVQYYPCLVKKTKKIEIYNFYNFKGT